MKKSHGITLALAGIVSCLCTASLSAQNAVDSVTPASTTNSASPRVADINSGTTKDSNNAESEQLSDASLTDTTNSLRGNAQAIKDSSSNSREATVESLMQSCRTNLAAGNLSNAMVCLQRIVRIEHVGRNAVWAHTLLGCIYTSQGNRGMTLAEFKQAEKAMPPNDAWSVGELWRTCARSGEIALAMNYGERYLALSEESNVDLETVQSIKKYLNKWKKRYVLASVSAPAPQYYTEQELAEALRQKLSDEELPLVVNPLACTREMKTWADELVLGATNELQKARLIFDALVQRGNANNAGGMPSRTMTAQEVFAGWEDSEVSVDCQRLTFLYVALARAEGLRTYVANVEEAVDGSKSPHVCAAVYCGDRALLVDDAFGLFGVLHKRFTVIDDLHVIAGYLGRQTSIPNLIRNKIAVSLAPDLAIVEAGYLTALMESNMWSEAQSRLPILARLDTVGAMANTIQAQLAIHSGDLKQAAGCLSKAIDADPKDFIPRFLLGDVYASQGRLHEALESYQKAMLCPHTESQAKAARRNIQAIQNKQNGN
jgi:tetratricopeptide (TPR) repeat protein